MELPKKKRGFVVPCSLSEGYFFKIWVLTKCIVYWIHFRNIRTSTYQKNFFIHFSCLLLKSSKAFSISLRIYAHVNTGSRKEQQFRKIYIDLDHLNTNFSYVILTWILFSWLIIVSSNINEVTRAALNSLFFLRKDFARTKSTKSTKSTKRHKDTRAKAQKRK